jgi:alanine racemase
VATARTIAKAGVKDFLVGKLEEARELRRAGVQGQILNFGPFGSTDAEEIVRAEITQNVFSDQVKELDRAAVRLGRRARVQIKVDTGLGRFGVHYERAAEFIRQVAALRGIRMNGVFTTLTEDREFDHVQLERLRKLRTASAREGAALGAWHAASSDAILELPEACREWDMVRPGIMLYGLYPSERAEKERKLELRPVLSLKARVTQVKTLAPGESASYHRAFVAAQPERVATIPCGYSDGLPRGLVGKGSVLVRGRRCPIVAITSNATIARLRDVAAETGDEAVYIGTQGGETVLTSEVATLSNSTVYAVAMGLNPLLPSLIL